MNARIEQSTVTKNNGVNESEHSKTLVTFVLFSYNQEKFIREAIKGAFEQTYSPLEIILSDDCSSDRTFEIMQEMAKNYTGAHHVKALRTPTNVGILEHFLLRLRRARGEIFVCAAGDDISLPNRCEMHVNCYNDKKIMAVTSGYDLIDHKGSEIHSGLTKPLLRQSETFQKRIFSKFKDDYITIQGATASYRTEVRKSGIPPWKILCSEDNLMNYLIYGSGKAVFLLKTPLVKYRQHDGALTNRLSSAKPHFSINHFRMSMIKYTNALRVLKWISIQPGNEDNINSRELNIAIADAFESYKWAQLEFFKRLKFVFVALRSGELRKGRWRALRLFGYPYKYQPLSLIQSSIKAVGSCVKKK